jgi:hypothetical protein
MSHSHQYLYPSSEPYLSEYQKQEIRMENQDILTMVKFVALEKQLLDWLGKDGKEVSQSMVKMFLLMM